MCVVSAETEASAPPSRGGVILTSLRQFKHLHKAGRLVKAGICPGGHSESVCPALTAGLALGGARRVSLPLRWPGRRNGAGSIINTQRRESGGGTPGGRTGPPGAARREKA